MVSFQMPKKNNVFCHKINKYSVMFFVTRLFLSHPSWNLASQKSYTLPSSRTTKICVKSPCNIVLFCHVSNNQTSRIKNESARQDIEVRFLLKFHTSLMGSNAQGRGASIEKQLGDQQEFETPLNSIRILFSRHGSNPQRNLLI